MISTNTVLEIVDLSIYIFKVFILFYIRYEYHKMKHGILYDAMQCRNLL